MLEKRLPARPSLEQYRKQAKDLQRECNQGSQSALARMQQNHPRFHKLSALELKSSGVALTDAQLVLAREHGFESWPRFAHHIETETLIRSLATLTDPVAAFLEHACAPRHASHSSGTTEYAELILTRYPQVATADIHTAATLGDEATVRGLLARDPANTTAKGGPHGWDALTHLCFSRYLRLDPSRSAAFVRTARALLESGASANTGWYETIDHPNPRQIIESVIYGAAGVARHLELTRLLLEFGAEPNDEETAYHVAEGYDNAVMLALLESRRFNQISLTTLLVRKADWHDFAGMKLALEYGGDPNSMTRFGDNALQHAIRRDNDLSFIALLLDYGANPTIVSNRCGRTAVAMAAHRGRADILRLLLERGSGAAFESLSPLDRLIAACARGEPETMAATLAADPHLRAELIAIGGNLLAEFAGTGNVEGLRCLLDMGVDAGALYLEGDSYFEIPRGSTALHVAALRAWHPAVRELIDRGAPVNAIDPKGRTPLALAVKACVDSYWMERRTPDSVRLLLQAGATTAGIALPTGYEAIDGLLESARRREDATGPQPD